MIKNIITIVNTGLFIEKSLIFIFGGPPSYCAIYIICSTEEEFKFLSHVNKRPHEIERYYTLFSDKNFTWKGIVPRERLV